ncbi:MAG: divergent polysaccharide deacetylase family protein [Alphaproteobacteria bacterium]|nr:divergent polysaccharide deacetylase family protein [Alphaproteobacteria bacterium]
MTAKPQKHKQYRRKRVPVSATAGFWRTPTGRVGVGVIVLAILTAIIGLNNGVDRKAPATAPPLASLSLEDIPREPALPAPIPEKILPRPGEPVIETLPRDPGARIPVKQAWLKNAVAAAIPAGQPMIAVVIDDVGLDRRRSRRAMALPAPVTIALMAYAEDAREQAAAARRGGHELLVHLPMEPGDTGENPGPNALLSDLPKAEFARRLEWNLTQFAGYVGVNNHMGSKLTSNPVALAPVMVALKQRGLMFLDSRTTSLTKGLEVARLHGVPAVERNVFIDHDVSPIAVRAALIRTEELAQRNGFAVAIGHPKDVTLDALEEWLPVIKARGFAVVPVTTIVRHVGVDG